MPFIYTNPHEKSYRAAEEELLNLEQERQKLTMRLEWIDQRLKHLENFVKAIAPLIADDPGVAAAEAGLTQMCREILSKNGRWIAGGEMRVMLGQVGIDLKPYSNPMAVLHSVLGRIGQKHRSADGTIYYADNSVAPFAETAPRPSDVIVTSRSDTRKETQVTGKIRVTVPDRKL
jgi:hypothetical protein